MGFMPESMICAVFAEYLERLCEVQCFTEEPPGCPEMLAPSGHGVAAIYSGELAPRFDPEPYIFRSISGSNGCFEQTADVQQVCACVCVSFFEEALCLATLFLKP